MFSIDFIFRQQENLVDNQKCQAGFRPLCNKIPFLIRIILASLTVQSEYLKKCLRIHYLVLNGVGSALQTDEKALLSGFGTAKARPHTGISCQNFFHSTIIPPKRVSWVSREANKVKEL